MQREHRNQVLRESRVSPAQGAAAARRHYADCGRWSLTFALIMAGIAPAREPVWVAQGAAPNTNGQVEGIKDREVSGAVNAVLPHPANADELYIGSVNGGIWKTTNATGPAPSWKQLTDDQQSLSIGALEFDPTDANHQTLVAGIGRFSSLENKGGARAGLLRTANGGTSWTAIKAG